MIHFAQQQPSWWTPVDPFAGKVWSRRKETFWLNIAETKRSSKDANAYWINLKTIVASEVSVSKVNEGKGNIRRKKGEHFHMQKIVENDETCTGASVKVVAYLSLQATAWHMWCFQEELRLFIVMGRCSDSACVFTCALACEVSFCFSSGLPSYKN